MAKGKAEIRVDPSRTLMVCVEGPKDGFWFYEDDFLNRPDHVQYRKTRRTLRHPSVSDATGIVYEPQP